ncbi:hypothetical protein J3A83DRAFT_4376870 [Scleroderma citrinum]
MAAEELENGHFRGTTTHNYTNTSRTAGTPMEGLEEEEDKDKEEQVEKNRGNEGEIFGGFSYNPIDILPGPELVAPMMAVLKTECKSTKVQVYLHDKEIAHLEAEKEKECVKAERAHHHMIESKRMDVEVLKKESEVLHLKLELAKLQAGQNTNKLKAGRAQRLCAHLEVCAGSLKNKYVASGVIKCCWT